MKNQKEKKVILSEDYTRFITCDSDPFRSPLHTDDDSYSSPTSLTSKNDPSLFFNDETQISNSPNDQKCLIFQDFSLELPEKDPNPACSSNNLISNNINHDHVGKSTHNIPCQTIPKSLWGTKPRRDRWSQEAKDLLKVSEGNYSNSLKNHFQKVKTSLKKLMKGCKDWDMVWKKYQDGHNHFQLYIIIILNKSQELRTITDLYGRLMQFLQKKLRINTWIGLKKTLGKYIPELGDLFVEIMFELLYGLEGEEDCTNWFNRGRMGQQMVKILKSEEYERRFRLHLLNFDFTSST